MKTLAATFSLFLVLSSYAFCADVHIDGNIKEQISAPGGQVSYYILDLSHSKNTNVRADLGYTPKMAIMMQNQSGSVALLWSKKYSDGMRHLVYFDTLQLSPDSKTLYFETPDGAVSDAVYSIDIATRQLRRVVYGNLHCVVGSGQYTGDLIIDQHKYYVQGGSYNPIYLFTPLGKKIGMLTLGGESDTKSNSFCPKSALQ